MGHRARAPFFHRQSRQRAVDTLSLASSGTLATGMKFSAQTGGESTPETAAAIGATTTSHVRSLLKALLRLRLVGITFGLRAFENFFVNGSALSVLYPNPSSPRSLVLDVFRNLLRCIATDRVDGPVRGSCLHVPSHGCLHDCFRLSIAVSWMQGERR